MAFLLLIAFILTPVIEIAVFIEVGGRIGLWSTIGIVILTAVIGTALLRQQGISVLFRIQENLEANRVPVRELFDGVCLVIAGALLLTPGFVTDTLGFLLFVPPVRQVIAVWVAARFMARADVHVHGAGAGSGPGRGPGSGRSRGDGAVIDGEYEDVTPEERSPDRRLPDDDQDPPKDR